MVELDDDELADRAAAFGDDEAPTMKRFFPYAPHLVHVVPTGNKVACESVSRCEHVASVEAQSRDDGAVVELWHDSWELDEPELWNTYVVSRGKAVRQRRARRNGRSPILGKRRGSVVFGDWYEAEPPAFAGHVVPVGMWFDRFGPEKGRKHIQGWAKRLDDGRWQVHKSEAAAKKASLGRGRPVDVRNSWAETAEGVVRKHMNRHRPSDIRADTIAENVYSSYLFPGRKGGWKKPEPFVVIVGTEDGNLRDPYEYNLVDYFDKVADSIRADPLYDDAGWESINAGVSYFWVQPTLVA